MNITLYRLVPDPAAAKLYDNIEDVPQMWALSSIDTKHVYNMHITRVKVTDKWEDAISMEMLPDLDIEVIYKPVTEIVSEGFFKIQKLQNEE